MRTALLFLAAVIVPIASMACLIIRLKKRSPKASEKQVQHDEKTQENCHEISLGTIPTTQNFELKKDVLENCLSLGGESKQLSLEEKVFSHEKDIYCDAQEKERIFEEIKHIPEEAQPQDHAGEHSLPIDDKRLEPVKRGGRPRNLSQREEKLSSDKRTPRQKPEIVCWKRERQWILAVEVPEALLNNKDFTILQEGSPLNRHNSREDIWSLTHSSGRVVAYWSEDGTLVETKINLEKTKCLLFRLSSQDQNYGRSVKSPSSGLYLVVVPESWKRDEILSGPPPVTSETVSLAGYQAHFFILNKEGGEIVFNKPEGEQFVIRSRAPKFELVGNQINDAAENIGSLFGKNPPRIRAKFDQNWAGVSKIVVGEENSQQGKWRKEFSPIPEYIEQDLPSEIATRKGGWYFLRLYDSSEELLESLDFRFLSGLKNINLYQTSYFPSNAGHIPARATFFHESDCTVRPVNQLPADVQIHSESENTIVIFPNNPACDESDWFVGSQDGPEIKVTLLVERLWWAVSEESNPPTEWSGIVLDLAREDIVATSDKALWFRFPKQRWIDRISVGFSQGDLRSYSVKVTEKTIAIPLRDFCDAQELETIGEIRLILSIRSEEIGSPCKVIIKAGCNFCDILTSKKEELFAHIGTDHLDQLAPALTLEELRHNYDPSLPTEIYKCSYCDFYVRSDDPQNPTSAIVHHISNSCEEARKEAQRRNTSRKVILRKVPDMDEIRKNIISSLPLVYNCKICNFHLKDATENIRIQHLVEYHQEALYKLR